MELALKPAWSDALPWELIRGAAAKYNLDPDLVAAIVQKESAGVQWRTKEEVRAEQDKYLYFFREHADRLGITPQTERIAQLHSYSYMQVMGWLARKYGFQGYLSQLCSDPELVLDLGCRLLHELEQRYHSENEIISAYNWGHVARTPGGLFLNQAKYVDPVCSLLRELRAF